jgi:MFS family permease
MREGLRFVVTHPILRRIVATTAASNFFGAMSGALFVLFLLRDLALDTGTVGLVYSASAVGGLLGAVFAGPITRAVGQGRSIPLSVLLGAPAAAATPLAAAAPPPWRPVILAAGGFGFFAFVVVYNVTQVSYRQRVCPPALLGRMNASVRFVVWGTQPLGALAGGFLGAVLGIRPVLWICVAGAALAALPVVASPLIRTRDL